MAFVAGFPKQLSLDTLRRYPSCPHETWMKNSHKHLYKHPNSMPLSPAITTIDLQLNVEPKTLNITVVSMDSTIASPNISQITIKHMFWIYTIVIPFLLVCIMWCNFETIFKRVLLCTQIYREVAKQTLVTWRQKLLLFSKFCSSLRPENNVFLTNIFLLNH